jgi:nucleotide-binding universal stress UspA family protein
MATTISGRPIVAGVDGSASAMHAACWAADEAARQHAPLRLVGAAMVSAFAYGVGFSPTQTFFDDMAAEGRNHLVTAEAAIHKAHPDLTVDLEQSTAEPVSTLITESEHARMLVLGSRGLGGFTGILVGSTAVALVTHGHCPVAVIRSHEPDQEAPTQGPVVVGLDHSAASEPALAVAFDEASTRGTNLIALHAWIGFSAGKHYDYTQMSSQAAAAHESELMTERLAGWQEKYPEVTVQGITADDGPTRCLLEHSNDAQLLVVGSRGHGGFTGLLLGSTSQALIYHATCPLLVVRTAATP